MSYDNPRLQLTDTAHDIIYKMSDGNPGAITVLLSILKHGDTIDPDAAMGSIMAILDLDTLDIYGSDIWVLYKYVCECQIARFMGLLRAWQLGLVDSAVLKAAASDPRGGTSLDVDGLLKQVKEKLPDFKDTYVAA